MLPEAEITPQDTLESIKAKYLDSQERLRQGFKKYFLMLKKYLIILITLKILIRG